MFYTLYIRRRKRANYSNQNFVPILQSGPNNDIIEVVEEGVDAVSEMYAEAYEKSGLTPDEIWEECICDSLGDMNIFERDKQQSALMKPLMAEIQYAAESETNERIQFDERNISESGVKNEPDGKASREKVPKRDKALYASGVSFLHKNFPPENERLSEAHRLATWWARQSDVAAGDQTLIFMNDVCYLVECFDDALNYYQVEDVVSKVEFDSIYKEIKQYGRSGQIKSVQGIFDAYDQFHKSNHSSKTGKSSIDSDETRYGRKDSELVRLASSENKRREQSSSNGSRDSQIRGENQQKYSRELNPHGDELANERNDHLKVGKASRDFSLSDEDYRNYGWVRDNNVISAGHWRTFTTNFADAVARDYYFNKTPDGEFMIETYNYYDTESTADVIVFAKGTIESPIITRIVKINSKNNQVIEDARLEIYAFERRGVYSEAGGILNIYTRANTRRLDNGRENGYPNASNNDQPGVKRSRSQITANPVVKSEVNEDERTVTVTYKNGDVTTEPWGKGKASRELDLIDYINEKAGREDTADLTKQQQLSRLRDELADMKVGTAELMAVQKVADSLFEQYGGDATVTEFRYAVFEATKLALERDGFDSAYEVIEQLSKEVAYNPKELGGAAQLLSDIKREIRGTKFSVHEADKTSGEFDSYGGYGEFRKRMFGKVNLTNDGVDVDSKYMELQNMYGEEFFPDVNTVSEQLMQLERVINTPLTDYMTESDAELNDKADDIAQYTFSSLGKVWSRAISDMDAATRKVKHGSPREMLAHALDSVTQSPMERSKLQEYKQNIDSLNEQEKKLFDIRTKINEIKYRKSLTYDDKALSVKEFEKMVYDIAESRGISARNVTFSTVKGDDNKGRYNAYINTQQVLFAEKTFRTGEEIDELKKLRDEEIKLENRLRFFDYKLLSLEASQPLRDVIKRERAASYRKATERGRETLKEQRERAREKLAETKKYYQESRARATEGRNKTARRHQIQSIAAELDRLVNRGTKERNVKKGESEIVRRTLDLSDMLFATDDDLIMRGLETDLTGAEEDAVNDFRSLYEKYHSYDNAVTENKDTRAELRKQMNEIKQSLASALERDGFDSAYHQKTAQFSVRFFLF